MESLRFASMDVHWFSLVHGPITARSIPGVPTTLKNPDEQKISDQQRHDSLLSRQTDAEVLVKKCLKRESQRTALSKLSKEPATVRSRSLRSQLAARSDSTRGDRHLSLEVRGKRFGWFLQIITAMAGSL